MVLTAFAGGLSRGARLARAIHGAVGFFTTVPVPRDDRAWAAFRETPAAFPLVGYALGAVIALPLLLPLSPTAVALAFVVWVYVVTGINHLDGLADLGDAVAAHGDADARRAVMTDTDTGVGGSLAVTIAVVGLALAAQGTASLPAAAAVIALPAEVGAKLGMAAIACFGTAAHEGIGEQFTARNRPRSVLFPAALSLPVVAVTWPEPAAAVALAAGVASALAVLVWARARLGGASGDVFGAANEVARVVALHAGVVAWMRW